MALIESISPLVMKNRKVEVVILEEGPGNKSRKCWYGREAIESGKDVFRGAQVYANHPSKTQQTDLPERDVRELIGRIKETYVVTENGKTQLRGVLKIMEGDQYDWALSLINESLQAVKEGFPPVAQMSIHADGDIEKRMMEGEQYNYVKHIKSAVSVDMVTKGGIKGAGFTKFVESKSGGKKAMTHEERMAMIQKKIDEALNSEDKAFLESADLKENSAADEGEDEYEEIYQTEDGTLVNEAGEEVDPAEVFAADNEGNVFTLDEIAQSQEANQEEPTDEDEPEYDMSDDEDEEEVEEPTRQPRMHAASRDEVPISELATRFPQVADEIDNEEYGVEESNRDVDVVNLKFENKLLKSRLIAERKILESGLPAGFISVDELLGKSADDMDRLIESKTLMVQNIQNLVESSIPATPAAATVRGGDNKPNIGRKILSESIMPTF